MISFTFISITPRKVEKSKRQVQIVSPNSFGFIEANCWTKEVVAVSAIPTTSFGAGERVRAQGARPSQPVKPFLWNLRTFSFVSLG
jgi:hypothetical protein